MKNPKKKAGRENKAPAEIAVRNIGDQLTGDDEDFFYIVGMGGSAGGLEAFEQFFKQLPNDTGMAFVLVPHLDPTHKGIMPELLQRFTSMVVHQARDGLKVQPNMVYVIPPNKDLAIFHGALQLLEPSAPRGLRLPIDFFFRHLAEDQRERSIGIILSGMGTDGTLGLRAIKEQLGMTMVQDPASAKFDSMPRSAIHAGLADYVAPVEEIPGKLLSFVNHYTRLRNESTPMEKKAEGAFQKVMVLLRTRTGNDFTLYKKNTLVRRIDRRMSVHQITSLASYVAYLQENEFEIDLLFRELLIGVTNFFRDPEAFELVKEKAIRPAVRSMGPEGFFRVWSPGCSTGEEVYSLAILVRECMEEEGRNNVRVQIYGTDIDAESIDFARQGLYPSNITADLSPERLKRFFIKEDTFFRIRKEIREMVVFAPQNIITDPPFTRLDLLCCRNLLIYLTPEIQKRLLPVFHYTLLTGGCLFLGPSETIGGFSDLFTPLDNKWKIFTRRESASALVALPEFPSGGGQTHGGKAQPARRLPKGMAASFQDSVHRAVIETVAPPVLIINPQGDLIYTTRPTGRYLEPSVGKAVLNVFEMAREGLKPELGIAVRKAVSQNKEVRIRGLRVRTNGDYQDLAVTVRLITNSEVLHNLLMVIIEEVPPVRKKKTGKTVPTLAAANDEVVADLMKELQYTRENLQSTIEEMETSQEETKSSNEELQSTNEELQSTNEELTTSREELQSLNEELMTLNAELQAKNDELNMTNNDMRNLLNSTQIPTLFLDNNLRIKRFTSPITGIFKLIMSDIGRPITDIVSVLQYSSLIDDARKVLETLVYSERQVETGDGRWFVLRIMPYRTMDNVIDGVVITLNDISDLKKLEASILDNKSRMEESEARFRALVESLPGLVWTTGPDGFGDYFGPQWIAYAGVPETSLHGNEWEHQVHPEDRPHIAQARAASAGAGRPYDLELRLRKGDGSYHLFRVRVVPLRNLSGEITRWFWNGIDMETGA